MRANVEYLVSRVVEGDHAGLMRRFVIAYKRFLTVPGDKAYKDWIEKFLKAHRTYHGCGLKDSLVNDKLLFESIKKNGMREPVRVRAYKNRVDIDGCHRLVIALVLGRKTIEYFNGGDVPYKEDGMIGTPKRKKQQETERDHWGRMKRNVTTEDTVVYNKRYLVDINDAYKIPERSVSAVDVGAGGEGGMSRIYPATHWTLVDPLMKFYKKLYNQPESKDHVNAGAEKMPFADNIFDIAFGCNALDHGTCRVKGFFEIHRILRPGGLFCVWLHCRTKEQLNDGHLQSFTPEVMREELEVAGFKLLGEHIHDVKPVEFIGVCKK